MSQLFRLKNGTVLLSTEAPGGIYNSGQLKKIAELCSKELAIVKATEDQRLALFVKESEVENVAKQLRAMGLGFRHYQDNLHQPVSCLGELCEEHEQPAMATAMDVTKEIASIQLSAPLKIGINGCARCCTPCHTLDIAVVGDASGYRISLGGKTRQMPEFASYFAEGVPPKELPKRLKSVIEAFKNLATEGETLHDVIERCGVTDFVEALAPYSQDAAQRKDPFAEDAAPADEAALVSDDPAPADEAALVSDDPALEAELESLDSAELDSLDELETQDTEDAEISSHDADAEALDLDSDLVVDDDLSIADETFDDAVLDEIPIEKPDQGSLEDDLALGGDDTDLAMNEVNFEDAAEAVTPENGEESLLDEASLESSATAELDVMNFEADDAALNADMDAESLDLETDDAALVEDGEAVVESLDDLSIESTAAVTEDDIDLGAADLELSQDTQEESAEADLDLDESLTLDDDLPEDLNLDGPDAADDAAMNVAEAPLDEDLEGIPELDEDLTLEDLPPAKTPAPAAVKAAAPAAAGLHDEFGEDHMPELSDEEESQFEQKLQASIDEESALIARADKDPNVGDREAALSLLENSESLDADLDVIELDDAALLEEPADDELDVISGEDEAEAASADDELELEKVEKVDDVLEPIQETMEEFPEPGPSELAHIKSRQLGQKLQGSSPRQQFRVSAISFQDEHMRVTFDTSAYVDFDLSALGLGEERNFRLGVQNVSVTSTSEGYILEVDGMRLFHPKTSFPAAS